MEEEEEDEKEEKKRRRMRRNLICSLIKTKGERKIRTHAIIACLENIYRKTHTECHTLPALFVCACECGRESYSTCVRACICVCACICMCMFVYPYVYVHVSVPVCAYICMCMCVYLYVYMRVSVCVCACICTYMCVYIFLCEGEGGASLYLFIVVISFCRRLVALGSWVVLPACAGDDNAIYWYPLTCIGLFGDLWA